MYICRLCHAENKPTAKFCRRCGVARPQEEKSVAVESDAEATQHAAAGNGENKRDEKAGDATPSAAELQMKMQAEHVLGEEHAPEPVEEITEEEVASELHPPPQLPPPAVSVVEGRADEGQSAAAEPQTEETGAQPASAPAPEPRPAPAGGTACASCGAGIRARDKFCIWCGEKQPERVPPPMKRCAECRTHLPMNANFCYVCGNDVGMHPRKRVRVPSELFEEEDPELYPRFEI